MFSQLGFYDYCILGVCVMLFQHTSSDVHSNVTLYIILFRVVQSVSLCS